jgi:outer membrane protein OmpA-like peptidoglycan-associated protein
MLYSTRIAPLCGTIPLLLSIWMCIPVFGQEYEVAPANFNSKEADFSGVFYNKDIVFCSTRAKTNLSFDEDSLTLYYTDLYISTVKSNGTYSNAEAIKGNVNTDYNEGHATFSSDGKRMFYTANLKKSLNNKFDKTSEYKLGIFMAEEVNGQWQTRGAFPYNSVNGKYSVAHPSLSSNDSVLYFCSNMPGGKGNSDIYRSYWINGQWSAPENLGSKVNSKGNEFFPFINEFDVLFFSTNSREDSEGMDIYYSLFEENEFQKPVRLNNSINSEYDEFAYQELDGINQGCFSSNRNDLQDDIFLFKKYLNTFNECHENYEANFCYHFFDEKLSLMDSLPIAYEWIMGDGTILKGDKIDYCYKDFGNFHVELNVVDTLTKSVFKKISETDITITKQDKPYILSHDTIYQNTPFECLAELISFSEFEVEKIEWEMDDGTNYSGQIFQHTFTSPGLHQIKCGISGKRKKNGVLPKICVYKNVVCVEPQPGQNNSALTCCDQREYEKIPMRPALLKKEVTSKQIAQVHKIIISESKTPLDESNSLFANITMDVTEIRTDSSYQYAVAETFSWIELLPFYKKLNTLGYDSLSALQMSASDLKAATIRIIPAGSGRRMTATKEIVNPKLIEEPSKQVTDLMVALPSQDISKINADSTNSIDSTKTDHEAPKTSELDLSSIKDLKTEQLPSEIKYRIALFESKERVPFNHPRFKNIKTDITELQIEDHYQYTIMAVPQAKDLSQMLQDLKNLDMPDAKIESFEMKSLASSVIRVGRYIEPKNARRLNIEFSKLSDIKFEYNSAEIKQESYKNLNYIAAMLMLEEDFTLKISAHTCSIGGSTFNQQLSEERANSVVAYFESKGIQKSRLIKQGFGLSQPIQTNETEMGRMANRRVEFTIVFQIDKL